MAGRSPTRPTAAAAPSSASSCTSPSRFSPDVLRVSRRLFLDGRPLLQDDFQLQHGLAELERVLGLEGDALPRRDSGAVDGGDAPTRVGDAQAVAVEPDEGKAVDFYRPAGVLLFGEIDVHGVGPLAAEMGTAFLHPVPLAGGKALHNGHLAFRPFGRAVGLGADISVIPFHDSFGLFTAR